MKWSGPALVRGAAVGGISTGIVAIGTWFLRERIGPFLEARNLELGLYLFLLVTAGVLGGGLAGQWLLSNPSTENRVGAGATAGALLYGGLAVYLALPVPVTLFAAGVGAVSGGLAAWELARPAGSRRVSSGHDQT